MTDQYRSDADQAPSFEGNASDAPFGTGFDSEVRETQTESSASTGDDDSASEGGRPSRRGGRRRRRRTLARSEADGATETESAEEDSARGRAAETAGDDDSDGDSPRRSKGRRRKRRRRANGSDAPADAEDSEEPEAGDAASDDPAEDGEASGTTRKRSRRRGGRRRKKASDTEDGSAAESTEDSKSDGGESDEGDADDGEGGSSRSSRRGRRRGSRGGRRQRKSDRDSDDAEEQEVEEETGAVQLDVIPGEDADFDPVPAPRTKAKRKTKRKAKKKASDADDEPRSPGRRKEPDVPRDQVILVNAKDPEDTRVVVVQDSRIVDLQMTVAQHKSYVNDIYRGRVVNIESAIGAAFVDFGQGRNGFLHVSDVMDVYGEPEWSLDKLLKARTDVEEWSGKGPKAEEFDGEESKDDDGDEPKGKKGKVKGKAKDNRARRGRSKRKTVNEVLEKGQLLVGQITKDAIGDKGPTLTTYISIPGRYLVLMPSLQRTGVSRKIEDEKERKRLKRILSGLSIPEGMGVIVRTAGVGKTKSEIKRDLDYLLAVWSGFSEKLVLGRSPAPLYQESDVAIRTMRDLFSSRTEKVLVDDPGVYERMLDFTKQLMPEHVDRIELHEANRPLFHEHGVEQDFEKVFARRVELPSGGSIMIDQTEALVAIDVNSGRTRDDGADFEDIALKTNLEAVPEIARQIRLRDMGGIVVIDFIDMIRQASRRKVEKALRDRLADDRARSKIGRISQFGLLEMTRQRLGPGLSKLLYDNCTACRGTGRRRTAQSRAQALLRRLGSALTQKGFSKIEILAHPDTIEWLKNKDREQLKALEEKYKRELVFKGVEDQTEDSIFHYLRADGREVRPGGRRKR